MTEIDIAQIRDELGDEVADFMLDVGSDFVNFVKLEAPVSSGDLRRSWQILSVEDGGERVVIGSPLEHALWVQTGRRPYPNDRSRWPPIAPLRVWARRKLNAESAAYAIRHTIGTEGIEPNDYVGRAIDRLRNKYQ